MIPFSLRPSPGFLPIPKPESYNTDLAAGGDETKGGIIRSGNMFGTTTQRGFVDLEDLDMENNENENTGEAEHKAEGRGREHALSASDAQELDGMAGGSSMRVVTGDVTQDINVDMSLDGRLPATWALSKRRHPAPDPNQRYTIDRIPN